MSIGLMVLALVIGLANCTFGFEALASPTGTLERMPAFSYVMFGVIALLASNGDLRVVRSGTLPGAPRLARHLWCMCFALGVAALSFFIGQAKGFPKPIRILPLLAVPLLAVLVTVFYWLWRVRIRRNPRGIARLSPSEAT